MDGAPPGRRLEALKLASGLQCFLFDGVVQSTNNTTAEAWLEGMHTYLKSHPVDGSVAVRSWKQGGKIPGWSLSELTGRLGGLLHDMGSKIDLT